MPAVTPIAARRDSLAERLDGWKPDEHPELRRLLDRLTHDLVSVIPTPPGGPNRVTGQTGV